MSRSKGAAGEREFGEILSAAVGQEVKRKLGAARDGGDDLEWSQYSFEVKRRETLAVEAWMAQAVENVPEGKIPVVAFRRNKKPWSVVLRLEDFLQLAAEHAALKAAPK